MLNDLNATLEIYPDSVEALILRGTLYSRQKCILQALHDFKEAVHLDPSLNIVWLQLAKLCISHFHQYNAAMQAADTILANILGSKEDRLRGNARSHDHTRMAMLLKVEANMRCGHSPKRCATVAN